MPSFFRQSLNAQLDIWSKAVPISLQVDYKEDTFLVILSDVWLDEETVIIYQASERFKNLFL